MSDSRSETQHRRSGIAKHIPSVQFLFYLLIGGWNTVFGYTCYFLMNRWLATIMRVLLYCGQSRIKPYLDLCGFSWL